MFKQILDIIKDFSKLVATRLKKGVEAAFADSNAELTEASEAAISPLKSRRILKQGVAMRVIFFYPGEEGTYIENPFVTLLENGVVHIQSSFEETTTHLRNCEILWQFQNQSLSEERGNKIRLLRPQSPHAGSPRSSDHAEPPEPEL